MSTTELNHRVYLFTKFEISFNEKYQKYIFKGRWTDQVDKDFLNNEIQELKKLFHIQLKIGLNNHIVIADLLELTGKRIDWLKDNEAYNISFIDKIKLQSKSLDYPPENKISPEDIIKLRDNEDYNYDNDFINSLILNSYKLDDYRDKLNFEKAQLKYCVDLYRVALSEINDYIMRWQMDLPTINIDKVEFTDLIEDKEQSLKCSTNWNKIKLARLFQFLKEENIIFFEPTNTERNGVLFNKFIENNFTYLNTKFGRQHTIENINKEFSEINSPINKEKQFDFYNELIELITKKRDQIKL
ncbi:hypothetical protein [Flavobacterium beibuense]|uniref:hypothetical protein n=1 Tax=Flavobacterium beibuense TaxID=657326 RepID=UPI003A90FF84